EALRLEASGNESSVAFDIDARRDAQSELTAVGALELADLSPQALSLEQMALRLDDATWALLNPAQARFTADEGARIVNLALVRAGPAPGLISIGGRIPPTGAADLTVDVSQVDLSDLNRISRAFPPMEG